MNLKEKLSRIVSEIFNGFLIMIITPTLAFIVYDLTLLYKILFPLLYILVTLIPYVIFKKLGKISDYEFTKREERPPYFTAVTGGYFVIFLLTLLLKDPSIIKIALAMFTTSCVLTIVNLYWKMSGHMAYSTLFSFTLLFLFPNITYLPFIFLFTPLIAISRVVLKRHSVLQVIAGTIFSATISILILWVL